MVEALLIDCIYNVAIGPKPLDEIPTHFTAHVPTFCLIMDNFLLPINELSDSQSFAWVKSDLSDSQISVDEIVYCPFAHVSIQTIQYALWASIKVCSSTGYFH